MSASSENAERLSQRVEERLHVLLSNESKEEQDKIARELEAELEKLGEWVSFGGDMTAQAYCTQVFLMWPGFIRPLLDAAVAADFRPESAESARELVETFLCFTPSWTRTR